MNENNIIKVLEYCVNDDCDNCPATFGNCEHNAMRNALNLIKRLKAENLKLTVQKNAFGAGMKVMAKEAKEAKAKYRKVNAYNQNLLDANAALSDEILEIRADTIAMFEKQVKAKIEEYRNRYTDSTFLKGEYALLITRDIVGKVARELRGEIIENGDN